MKEETVIILIVAGVALLFWATSSGLLKVTGGAVPVGNTGILAPQPSQNYSGYLAASTAPGVSSALNSIIGGLGTSLGAWLSPSGSPPPPVGQGASSASPSGAAQPIGVPNPAIQPTSISPSASLVGPTLVGPQIPPLDGTSYDATLGSAYDYNGLSAANSFDPSYSLMES
jgi:hypothetical protein